MVRYVGLKDACKIGIQADKSTESLFSTQYNTYLDISNVEWNVNNDIQPRATVGGGRNYNAMVPGLAQITGRVDARLVDGRAAYSEPQPNASSFGLIHRRTGGMSAATNALARSSGVQSRVAMTATTAPIAERRQDLIAS